MLGRGPVSVNTVSDASAPAQPLTRLGGIWEDKSAAFPLRNRGVWEVPRGSREPIALTSVPWDPWSHTFFWLLSSTQGTRDLGRRLPASDREGPDRSGLRFRDSGPAHICQLCVLGHSLLASLGLSFPLCETKRLGSQGHAAPM